MSEKLIEIKNAMISKVKSVGIIVLCILMFHKTKSQMIHEKFDKLVVSENFDQSNNNWSTVSNNDNLFVMQDGEYILNRKTAVSPFAILSGFETNFEMYRLVTSLKVEKTGSDETALGILFMAQPNNKGGYMFEINKFKEYRIRRMEGAAFKNITGDAKNSGWVKHPTIVDLNLPNLVEIRTANSNFDLFINNTFVQTFNDNMYTTGKMGLIVGPATKGRVDFFYVFTNSKPADNVTTQTTKSNNDDVDISALAESIINLKTQINKLKEDNGMLRKTIDAMKGEDGDIDALKKSHTAQLESLQNQLSQTQTRLDSTNNANKELVKYRDMIKGDENSDLLITLSKTVKTERDKNIAMQEENKQLRDSLEMIRAAVKSILGNSIESLSNPKNPPPVKSNTGKPNNQQPPPKTGGNLPAPLMDEEGYVMPQFLPSIIHLMKYKNLEIMLA